jgi:hypothetical protein
MAAPADICFIRSKLRLNIFVSARGLPPTNSQSTITLLSACRPTPLP